MVAEGRVKIYRLREDGREQVVDDVGPGNTFAEAALFHRGRFPAYAAATESPTRLVKLDATRFLRTLRTDVQSVLREFDPAQYDFLSPASDVDRLTALLTTLLQRRGRVQTRETLLNHVWEMNGDVTTRTVDTHVRRLRKKLGEASDYIETLRGVGYRFKPEAPPPG